MLKPTLPYIRCHGSGNRFVLIDAVRYADTLTHFDPRRLAQESACDGLLLLVQTPEGYAMRMFNTDGSEAEMCGNGIRCVARLARERYIPTDDFILQSGGREYPIRREKPLFGSLPTYGVEIAIRLSADDFLRGGERFLQEEIADLEPSLRFTYLNLGNPHLVAFVEQVDYTLLSRLGERVKSLPEWFPRGINLSLVRPDEGNRIFVATYERGVGLTDSCGTAMTASSTAATLLGYCHPDEEIRVDNRGGRVRCCCHIGPEGITTRLVGNATFEAKGTLSREGEEYRWGEEQPLREEQEAYADFLRALKEFR